MRICPKVVLRQIAQVGPVLLDFSSSLPQARGEGEWPGLGPAPAGPAEVSGLLACQHVPLLPFPFLGSQSSLWTLSLFFQLSLTKPDSA